MKKRIVAYQVLFVAFSLSLALAACLFWADRATQEQLKTNLQAALNSAVFLKDDPGTDPERFINNLALQQAPGVRVTLIDLGGVVLGDSVSDPRTMENHGTRPEVAQALREGYGEYQRRSATTGSDTLYLARAWGDEYILRFALTSTTLRSLAGNMTFTALVIFTAVTLLAFAFANRTSERIMRPFYLLAHAVEATLDPQLKRWPLESDYEELAPIARGFNELSERLESYIAELQEQSQKIERIVAAMQEGLLLLDEHNGILLSNPQAIVLLGLRQSSGNLLHLCREERLHSAVKRMAREQKAQEFDLHRGETALRLHLSPVPGGGSVILISDVSHIVRLERMRSEFTANVSHELKTPLTAISGFGELVASGMVTDSETMRMYALRSFSEAQRLISLIGDILLLSEIETTEPQKVEAVDLRGTFLAVLDTLQTAADELALTVTIAGDGKVLAHQAHLQELILCLMENAVKYNKPNGFIKAEIRQQGEQVCFALCDSGIGIPEEHQERIFERFYRVDKARSRKTGGTGLGLSIAKHIAERYKGSIKVSSDASGSTFTVCLPSA